MIVRIILPFISHFLTYLTLPSSVPKCSFIVSALKQREKASVETRRLFCAFGFNAKFSPELNFPVLCCIFKSRICESLKVKHA